jgi:hypothetical protein
MMALETIRNQSRQATQRAAAVNRQPLAVEADDLVSPQILKDHLAHMPLLGDYTPKGFKEIDVRTVVPGYAYEQFLVDGTGWGTEGEAALTLDEFFAKVQLLGPGYTYALGERGQFQINVRLFQRKG